MWRDREKTLEMRAAGLEEYLNALLLSGSHDTVVAVADFVELNFLLLAGDFLQMAGDSSVEGTKGEEAEAREEEVKATTEQEVASDESFFASTAFSVAHLLYVLVGVWWVLIVTVFLLARHVAVHYMELAQSHASRYLLPPERLPSALRARLASYADRLAPLLAALYLHLDASLIPGGSLTDRLPTTPRAYCVHAIEAVWPRLAGEVRKRATPVADAPSSLAVEAAEEPCTACEIGEVTALSHLLKDDATATGSSDTSMSSSTYSAATLGETAAWSSAASTPKKELTATM